MTSRKTTILIVDHEQDIIDFIDYNLKKEGYDTIHALNGREALKRAKTNQPDLILMDVMMPELDGIQACREIRDVKKLSEIPVVFLTARNEEFTELAGFSAGADDFITKPVKPRILTSRIKAILKRRMPQESEVEVVSFKGLIIDRESYQVSYLGTIKKFPKKEFELLALLSSKPGKVFSREEILEKVDHDEILYKLTLKFLRRDGYDIGNYKIPEVKKFIL